MRPRWKKVLADLFSNPARSLLVIASIAIGLFAIGMIATLHQMLYQDMVSGYARVNPANIQVRAAYFDRDFANTIERLPGVKEAEAVAQFNLRLEVAPDEYITVEMKAIPHIEKQNINRVTLVEGIWPPGKNEIVVNIDKLAETGASLGDDLVFLLPSGETRTLKLVGVVHDQTIGSASGGGGFFMSPLQGYINFDTLESLQQPLYPNRLYVTVDKNLNDLDYIRQVNRAVLDEFDQNGYKVFTSVTRRITDHPNANYLEAIGAVLIFLGLLVVFLSGFLITNTLSALLNQQIQQVGVMKTFGATRWQINSVYMVLILVYSLIALAIAIPTANWAAYLELNSLTSTLNFASQGQRAVPPAIILQVVIALVVPQVAGAIPIRQGSRVTIQQALNSAGGSNAAAEVRSNLWLSKIRGISRPLMISLRNTFRRKVRLALTLITLILGGSIFIATFNVRISLDHFIQKIGRYYIADVNLSFSQPYRIDEIKRLCMQIPGIAQVEGWASALAEMVLEDGRSGEAVVLQAPPVESKLIESIMIKGRWIQPGDENAIVLSELFLSDFPEIQVGDTIELRINDKVTKWVVVGFFQFGGKNTGLFAYTNYDYLAHLTRTQGKAAQYRVVASGEDLTLEQQKELGRQLQQHFESLGFNVTDVRAGKSLRKMASDGLDVLTTFLLIMALLMASVGSIGLSGTMGLNVMERTREIGILRAIGATDGAIMKLILTEGVLISLISWVFSVVFSLPISIVLSNVLSTAIFSMPIQFTYTYKGVVIWLAIVIVLSILASVLPARNAARLTIREVLSYE